MTNKRVTALLSILAVAAAIALPVFTAAPALADDQPVNVAVRGGTLHATLAGVTLPDVVLDGASAQTVTGVAPAWTLVDARGSGAAWALSVSGTDFQSAAGTTDSTIRTIPIGALTITPGTIAAVAGSDAVPSDGAVTVTSVAQSLVWTTSGAKGSFTLAPTFGVSIPSNAFRSNFVAGTTGAVQPYVATLTFTIA